jgi:hypothetical protein
VDSSTLIAFPRPGLAGSDAIAGGAGDEALTEIDVAIAMVAAGAARRVRLTALPFIESVASVALAHARAAGIAFQLERPDRVGVRTVTIGPVDRSDEG